MAHGVALIYPTYGHLSPVLPVVAELVALGDRVTCYGTGRSRARIEAAGAAYRAYPRGHDAFNPTPPTEGLFSDMVRLMQLSSEILPALIEEVRAARPDYLLLDTKSLWGRLVAQVLGIPAVTLSVVFAIRPGVIGAAALADMLYAGAPVEAVRDGLGALSSYFDTARAADRRFRTASPDILGFLGNPQPLTIVFTSRAFQLREAAFGDDYVFVGASLAASRPDPASFPFDGPGPPLVYLSLGTTFNDAPDVYRHAIRASEGQPWRLLISTGGAPAGAFGPLPDSVAIAPFVPQLRVLERAAVFVTHGGMNSATEAQYFGVPMVVLPQRGDQYLVGARVAELGAGVALAPPDVSAGALRARVAAVLAEAPFREAAARLRAAMREAGGPRRAAAAIAAATR